MFAGDGSDRRADRRLPAGRAASPTTTSGCSAIIANQVAVGVQNARLHAFVRAGKQEWEATFDAMGDAIAVFDRHGRLLRGNAALAAYLDRPVTALRGLTCDEIGLCGGPFPQCAVGRAAGSDAACTTKSRCPAIGSSASRRVPWSTRPTAPRSCQIAKNVTLEIQNARRMRQMSDELAAANSRLVATVDRLKATQAQLLQAEKLSAIGQLVAGVAHELNNPLTSVIGYAQLLQEELRDAHRGGHRAADRGAGARPAPHRRGVRARRADRPQPAGVRAPAVGRARGAGHRRRRRTACCRCAPTSSA